MASETPKSLFDTAMPTTALRNFVIAEGYPAASTMGDLPTVDTTLCENGNLLVVVNLNPGKVFRISAEHLCLASAPFRVMLGPDFKDGASRPKEGSKSWILRLPEDDSHAAYVLFNILHHQPNDVNITSIDELKAFAILIDKYDCNWPKADELAFLCIAFALGDHQRFYEATRRVIYHSSNNSITNMHRDLSDGLASTLPRGLLDSVNDQRKKMITSIHDAIENLVIQYSGKEYNCDEGPGTYCNMVERVGHLVVELVRVGLWPLAKTHRHASIQTIMDGLVSFATVNKGLVNLDRCRCERVDFPAMLAQIAQDHHYEPKGLCIICAKDGKYSLRDGNCCRYEGHLQGEKVEESEIDGGEINHRLQD